MTAVATPPGLGGATAYDDPAVADAAARRDVGAYMAALDAMRLRKLRHQLHWCFGNDYFHGRMRQAGIADPREIDTMAAFRGLPAFMTKADHRESQAQSRERHGHPFGMHLCAPVEDVVHVAGTSGTTGLPTFYLFTRPDLENAYTTLHRLWRAAGIRRGDTVLHLFGLSIWVAGTTMMQSLEAFGARPIPLGAEAGVGKALQYLQMCRPRVVMATPSMLRFLIERAPAELGCDVRTLGVEVIVAGGEPGLAIPEVRRALFEGFGCPVFDMAAGAWHNAALDCGGPVHQGLHFHAEDLCFRYDLVDPETREPLPLEDGATGEAIHTALAYQAAPALRYATGDVMQLRVGECPHCGFFGARYGFAGRADDLLNIAGVKIYPSAVQEVVNTHAPAVSGAMEIQLDQRPPRVVPPLRLVVEAGPGVAAGEWGALASRLEDSIHARLRVRSQVRVVGAGELGRSQLKTRLIRVLDPQ